MAVGLGCSTGDTLEALRRASMLGNVHGPKLHSCWLNTDGFVASGDAEALINGV